MRVVDACLCLLAVLFPVGSNTDGAAFFYELTGGTWSKTAQLSLSANSFFGTAVTISPNQAVVGAYGVGELMIGGKTDGGYNYFEHLD